MADSTLSTAPEQQIPNYADRAAAVEDRVRDLFATSLAAGSLAVLESGIVTSPKQACFDSSTDHVYFDIGMPIGEPSEHGQGSLFRHYWDKDDLPGDAIARYYWPRTYQANRHTPYRWWEPPTFPAKHDPNDMVRGGKWPRFHPLNYFNDKGAIYIAAPGEDNLWERKIGWVPDDDDRKLYVDGGDFFQPDIRIISRNLNTIEGLLGITATPGEIER